MVCLPSVTSPGPTRRKVGIVSDPVDALVSRLRDQPDAQARVRELPPEFRDPDLMTLADGKGLIEFGRRKHVYGGGKLHLEEGYEWFRLAVPNRKPMTDALTEDKGNPAEVRLLVRLTAAGRIRAAELRLNPSRNSPEPTPLQPQANADQECWDGLTDLQREILRRMVKEKHTCAERRASAEAIAESFQETRYLNVGGKVNAKRITLAMAQLVTLQLVKSREGRGGGYWATDHGCRLVASQITQN
jgi:hypothetical protein